VSTVLDALKKLQSERDRQGDSDPGALQQGVVDGGAPEPKRRHWVAWLASLGILVTAGAAAGYFLLGTDEETPALAMSPSSSEGADAGQRPVARREGRSAAESRSESAAESVRPDPRSGPTLEEQMAKQNEEILARLQKKRQRGARARKTREQTVQARAGSSRQALAAEEKPALPTPGARTAAGSSEAVPEDDAAPPKPLVQPAPTSVVRAAKESDAPREAGEWEAGSGSVRMTPRMPDPPSPKPGPPHAVAPAPEPEPTPRMASKPAPRESSKVTTHPEAEPSELLDAPLATDLPFPEVSLEAVRWHPDAGRREARLMVDNRRPVDVREGDIVAGVAVRRIDPGAVELTVGTSRMLVRIGE
jgi:hypothetical protein